MMRLAILLALVVPVGLVGCRDDGTETRDEARARSRAAATGSSAGAVVPGEPAAASELVQGEPEPQLPPKPEHEDEARQWALEALGDGWTVHKGAAAKKLHPEAVVSAEGPDGCKGAVIVREHAAKDMDAIEAVARERLAELKDDRTEVLWFDRVHYSGKGAVRFQTLRRPGGGGEVRRQYSVIQANGYVYELLVWSVANSTVARHCLDRVTASLSVW